jgi:hypothetical protein
MSGGITQLVAIGVQDAWLTGKPEVSFFRNNYKRHTNFAHVVQRQVIQGAVNASGMSSIRLERRGDMVSYVYLTKKTASTGAQAKFVNTDIDHIDFLIGGQVIDSQTNEFMDLIADPFLSSTQNKAIYTDTDVGTKGYAYPLRFWFCENWQSALPLIALQYHDVEIRIYWASTVSTTSIYEAWANFVVLDVVEREDFASRTQNHLIYQVQKATPSGNKTQNLVFNHPIKFIAGSNVTSVSNTTTGNESMLLQINGVDIGEQKSITPHFNLVPNYYTVPFTNGGNNQFLLPFCLDTSKLQPTGTLNFSRIDSARLVSSANFSDALLGTFYAVNYNILKIENGMGGLLYAN